jgi:hypothetical protein
MDKDIFTYYPCDVSPTVEDPNLAVKLRGFRGVFSPVKAPAFPVP